MASNCRILLIAIVTVCPFAIAGISHLSTSHASSDNADVASGVAPDSPRETAAPALAATDRDSANASDIVLAADQQTRHRSLAELARTDPWSLTKLGLERYKREIHDYTCVFQKRERIGGKLRDTEEIEVRYREEPKSVFMVWKRNADQAKRVLFVDSSEFVNDDGEKVARVEPAGVLIRLVVSDVMMPIHGKAARKSSRRSIDEFGFRSTFGLLEQYNGLAKEHGVLDFRYVGEDQIDGRPTYKMVRYLPYEGEGGMWPDAKMVLHLDQEWLLPTAVYSYADHEGRELLGSYVMTKVNLNPRLGDDDFEF